MAPFQGAKVAVPALYVTGERDLVVGFPGTDEMIARLRGRSAFARKDDYPARLRTLDSAREAQRDQQCDDRVPGSLMS